ncbi:hypothetical protein X975_10014, partial [Stegodyphus mimosarum]
MPFKMTVATLSSISLFSCLCSKHGKVNTVIGPPAVHLRYSIGIVALFMASVEVVN